MLEALSSFIIHFIQSAGYVGIFGLMTLGSSFFPIPSEAVLSFSGFLISTNALSWPLVVLAAAIGDTVGSVILYSIGYLLEERVIVNIIRKHGKYVLLSEHEYQRASSWFRRYGSIAVLIGKLLPGLRLLISLPPGILEMNIWKFIAFSFLGGLIWATALTSIGYFLGSKWDTLGNYFRQFELLILVVIILAILWYLDHKLGLRKKLGKK